MGRQCVFGCSGYGTLFPFPSDPWLRRRWLEFAHFEERALNFNSRLCNKHFPDDAFDNLGMFTAGLASYLKLAVNAVPSLYTVGTSPPTKLPATRNVGCQTDNEQRNASVQVKPEKIHRISKAIQVRPLTKTSATGTSDPSELTPTPRKRPRCDSEITDSGVDYS